MNHLRRSFLPKLATITALLVFTLAPDAAPGQHSGPVSLQGYGLKIYRVESGLYPFVHVYFRTFDQNQDPLVNLNALNIGLMVKGRSYDPTKRQYGIQPLRQRPEAVRSVIVLDASKSMVGKPFEDALQAAVRFIDQKRPQDQISILAVRDTDRGYDVISDWERDARALVRRLTPVKADGNQTRLYDTIGAAMQMTALVAQESPSTGAGEYPVSNAIVVFSDGMDEGSALSREELNGRISSLETPIPIYSVAYTKVSQEHFKNLEALSKNSFGVYFPVGQATERMQQVVERIQNILLGDYVVTFRSYLPVDGERHALKLGLEYPTGSGKFTYQSAHFEALEPPPVGSVTEQLGRLSKQIPALPDGNPYMSAGGTGAAE